MVLDKRPIYSLSFEGGVTKLSLNGSKFVLICSIILAALILLNVLSSCMFSISCGRFLPTVSFVGSLVTHDKILVATCTFCFILCQVVVISYLTELRNYLTCFDMIFTYLTITLFSGLLVCASIVDEVNGLVFLPIDGFHIFFSLSALVVGCTWLYYILDSFSNSRLKSSVELEVAKKLSICLGLMAGLTVVEWQLANSLYWNFFINENVEAICEWTLLGLAIATPVVLVQALPQFRVSLSLECV